MVNTHLRAEAYLIANAVSATVTITRKGMILIHVFLPLGGVWDTGRNNK